jgi:predicted nucleic acid-binding protein
MKYYFDTSSLVKIYHREKGTEIVLSIYKGNDKIIISELSKIEFISTIYRKYREHEISNEVLNLLIHKFENDIKNRYDEVLQFSSLVTDEAWNLICSFSAKYSLKTQDSIQLAFYNIYCETDTIFVCSDDKFVKVIEQEGIAVLFVK